MSSRQSGLQSEFQVSQSYTEKPCVERSKKKRKKISKTSRRKFKRLDALNENIRSHMYLFDSNIKSKASLLPLWAMSRCKLFWN